MQEAGRRKESPFILSSCTEMYRIEKFGLLVFSCPSFVCVNFLFSHLPVKKYRPERLGNPNIGISDEPWLRIPSSAMMRTT
jgi:hypothetical protein